MLIYDPPVTLWQISQSWIACIDAATVGRCVWVEWEPSRASEGDDVLSDVRKEVYSIELLSRYDMREPKDQISSLGPRESATAVDHGSTHSTPCQMPQPPTIPAKTLSISCRRRTVRESTLDALSLKEGPVCWARATSAFSPAAVSSSLYRDYYIPGGNETYHRKNTRISSSDIFQRRLAHLDHRTILYIKLPLWKEHQRSLYSLPLSPPTTSLFTLLFPLCQ